MRSLALKLTLAFLLVAVAAVALVGSIVTLRVRTAYDHWVVDQQAVRLAALLESYYETRGSWAGVQTLLERMHAGNGQIGVSGLSLALLDSERTFVGGTGDFSRPGRAARADVGSATALQVDGTTVGWLVSGPGERVVAGRQPLPETVFLERIRRAILYGTLGAIGLALVLGVVLASTLTRPIRELTAATQAVATGELGRQVSVDSEDEIGRLAASFNQMSADLARTSEVRRQMTADVAHELRTPLSVLVGYAEALQDGKLQGTPETYAALHDTARHLQRLVDDLGVLALADAGELSLNRRPVEPLALLERTVLAHKVRAEQAGVTLDIAPTPDLPAVSADPERIAQVLNNLVANALRHTAAGGEILLSAELAASGRAVLLRVRDTGAGIAPEDLPSVFERFYRGDKARSPNHGAAGLGLAIARSLVESHGGSIEVASTLGQGTTFTFSLPTA